jgi:hypothetical protein
MTFETEPTRWADGDADALVERLIRAGRADGPSARVLRAAPVAVAALVSTTAASATLAQAGLGGAAMTSPNALSPLLLVKWVAVGSLASTSVLALVHAPELMRPASGVPVVQAPSSKPQTPVRVAAPALVAATASASAATSPAATNATAPPRADVAREVTLLDAARTALVEGNAGSALRALDSLERLPGRALGPEATVLRVRALLAQGDAVEARRVAERFLASAPNAPQAAALRALLENSVIQPRPSGL